MFVRLRLRYLGNKVVRAWNRVDEAPSLPDIQSNDPGILKFRSDHGRLMHENFTSPAVKAGERLSNFMNRLPPKTLLKALSDENKWIRSCASDALLKHNDPRLVDKLVNALDNCAPVAKTPILFALGKLGNPRCLPRLQDSLSDADSEVRMYTAEALGRLRDASAVPSLDAALSDGSEKVRIAAATALGEIGGMEAVKRLSSFVSKQDPKDLGARRAAAKALLNLHGSEVTPEVRVEWAIIAGDYAAAAREGATAIVPLLAFYDEIWFLDAMGRLRGTRFDEMWQYPAYMKECVESALESITDGGAFTPLLDSLCSASERIATRACYLLGVNFAKRIQAEQVKQLITALPKIRRLDEEIINYNIVVSIFGKLADRGMITENDIANLKVLCAHENERVRSLAERICGSLDR